MKPAHPYYLIGRHFYKHYRTRAKAIGLAAAMKRMRKDGVPVEICSVILTSRELPAPDPTPTLPSRIAALFRRKD